MKKAILLTILMAMTLLLFAGQYTVNSNQNEVNLISTDAQSTILEMTLGHFEREAVRINNDTYWALSLKKEGFSMETGMPQLPYVTRSIIIPGMAKMAFNVLESEYTDIVMPIVPSKGSFTRDIDPNTVAWSFDPFYQSDGFYPAELARLSESFIIRDYRGITVHFQPFVYFPATQTLRVYTRLKLSVNNIGTDNNNTMSAAKTSASAWFEGIYKGMFLNYNQAKYPVLDEFGRMLIVKNSMFNASLQPFIDWKRQKGFVVDVVDITTAGPTANQLKTYIQNQYDMNTDLAFVQIIGDHAQVPSLSSGGGASDPSFGLLAGSDSYPDIFVGRFSAENVAELETQITRTLNYELAMQTGNDWLAKGMGIASNEGGGGSGDLGESDQVHIEYIRTDL
ncbi:MAG: gingipain R, partial [Candidatus Cloacimonetes bacterium]|nr:gingipain R [Candidatus Cloacimonadota bacterium]